MKLSNKTQIIIISHFSYKDAEKGAGAPHNIRNYLKDKVGKIIYIDHPFPWAQFHSSQATVYKDGKEYKRLTWPVIKGPDLFQYLHQILITVLFLVILSPKCDICFALDDLSLISVLPFRKLGLFKKVIYYCVDYTPQRFPNKLLNHIYHLADRISSLNSDYNWVTTQEIITAKSNNGVSIEKVAPFQIVPIGFRSKEIVIKPVNKIDRFHLVYVGVLYEKQGLQLAIETLPILVKKFPKIHLTIAGAGPFETQLKAQVRKLKLKSKVDFLGYIDNHQEITSLLTNCGVGIAPYAPIIGSFTYFADPSKIKLYLLCGLPVVTTNVPPISQVITAKNAGITIDYNTESFYASITKIIGKDHYLKYRNAALSLGKEYNIDLILEKAFRKIDD